MKKIIRELTVYFFSYRRIFGKDKLISLAVTVVFIGIISQIDHISGVLENVDKILVGVFLLTILYFSIGGCLILSTTDRFFLETRPVEKDMVFRIGILNKASRLNPIIIFLSLLILFVGFGKFTIGNIILMEIKLIIAILSGILIGSFLHTSLYNRCSRWINNLVSILVVVGIIFVLTNVMKMDLYRIGVIIGTIIGIGMIIIELSLLIALTNGKTSQSYLSYYFQRHNVKYRRSYNLGKSLEKPTIKGAPSFAYRQWYLEMRKRNIFANYGLIFASIMTLVIAVGLKQTVNDQGQSLPTYISFAFSTLVAGFFISTMGTSNMWSNQIRFHQFDLYPYYSLHKAIWISFIPWLVNVIYGLITITIVSLILPKGILFLPKMCLLLITIITILLIPFIISSYMAKRIHNKLFKQIISFVTIPINLVITGIIATNMIVLYGMIGEKNIMATIGANIVFLLMVVAVATIWEKYFITNK